MGMNITPTGVRWNVATFLEQHEITAYKLIKASGLHQNTVYALARGEYKAINLDTLAAVVRGLESLTGQTVSVSDLLEVVRENPKATRTRKTNPKARVRDLTAEASTDRALSRPKRATGGVIGLEQPVKLTPGPSGSEIVLSERKSRDW